jgi:hypothetical protein
MEKMPNNIPSIIYKPPPPPPKEKKRKRKQQNKQHFSLSVI